MIQNSFENIAHVRNNLDSQHCLQFAFMAAIETLGHPPLTVEEAERVTGFQPGGTWPYTMLTWFSGNGFEVRHIENTNFERFISDPRAELEAQGLDNETIGLFFEITDFEFEGAALKRALDDPDVTLESRIPVISDITGGLENGWLPLVSLDAGTLSGAASDEFDGHMVLATGHSQDEIRFQDPGPPARWDWDGSFKTVLDALRTPSDSSGTVTLIRKMAQDGSE